MTWSKWIGILMIGGLVFACSTPEQKVSDGLEDPVLSDLSVLMSGVPDKADLVEEKTDQLIPFKFLDLLEWQSPVKSQGRRGVCSIFATIALMEHLYIKEGTYQHPDFSEQYLQWSVKFKEWAFPNSSGSNADYNLRAISNHGIVEEVYWPYEIDEWDSSVDPACDGNDSQPTYCYTNGHPPQSAQDAQKWFLPPNRWISSRVNSLKSFMVNNQQAVVVGMTFFYQSWNHRRSPLPINSDYWEKGYVLYPNTEDKRLSLENRAGHAILLVGWDDELEVQSVDENGEPLLDSLGNPVMQKGFFLFKNSWGTGNFGVNNYQGDGYGWISYQYIEEYANAQVSDVPRIQPVPEICSDGIDNDRDGYTDCEDPDCSQAPNCNINSVTYQNHELVYIPDADPIGIMSTIDVPESFALQSLAVSVDISHTYVGDLEIVLHNPDAEMVVLLPPTQRASKDLVQTFETKDFNGQNTQGIWTLQVIDHAAVDVGSLNSWKIEFTR